MADDAKLKVKIELDDRDFKKKVRDLKKGETVKMKTAPTNGDGATSQIASKLFPKGNPLESIGKAFEGIKGAIGGAAGGAGASGAGSAIAGGAAAGLAGGAVLGALTLIATGVTALVGMIVESSAILKNTIGNILKVIMLILRPIGDVIGSLLRPLIWVLMPMAKMLNLLFKPFLMSMRKRMLEEKQAGSYDIFSGNFDPIGAQLRSVLGALGDWGAFLVTTGLEQLLLGLVDAMAGLATAITENTLDSIIILLNLMKAVVGPILGAIDSLLGFIGITTTFRKDFDTTIDTMIGGVDDLKTKVTAGIETWRVNTRAKIVSAFDLMETAFTDGLNAMITIAENFKARLTNVPSSSGGSGGGGGYSRVWQNTANSDLKSMIDDVTSGSTSKFTNLTGQSPNADMQSMIDSVTNGSQQVGSSYIPETGSYNLHRGEQVLRANENSGQSIVVSPTINISANVNNRFDIRKLADELSDILTENMQSELRRRVSYL